MNNGRQAIEDEQGLFLSEARRILSEGFFMENTEGVNKTISTLKFMAANPTNLVFYKDA